MLRDSGGDFAASAESCVEANQPLTGASDPFTPDPGEGVWYLLRPETVSGSGGFGSGGTSETASRDEGLALSGLDCN